MNWLKNILINSILLPQENVKYFIGNNQLCMTRKNDDNWIKEIAIKIANKSNMPYCWEDIENRLRNGYSLPFKLED